MLRHLLLLALLAPTAQGAPSCEGPSSATDVLSATQQVSLAWATQDGDALKAQHEATLQAVQCMAQPLDAPLVSQVHLAEALAAFYARDYSRSEQAFAGLLAVDPNYEIPDVLNAPPPLLERLARARELGSLYVATDAPGYVVLVDGVRANERPANRGAVVQMLNPDSSVLWTRYVQAGKDLPPVPTLMPEDRPAPVEQPVVSAPVITQPPERKHGTRDGFGVGFDVGVPTSFRMEGHFDKKVLRAIGGRLLLGPATSGYSASALFGVQAYVDLGVARKTSVEVGPFFGSAFYETVGGGGVAVKHQLTPVVHLQAGGIVGGSYSYVVLAPDVHVGFLW